jgi:hypothetical protein
LEERGFLENFALSYAMLYPASQQKFSKKYVYTYLCMYRLHYFPILLVFLFSKALSSFVGSRWASGPDQGEDKVMGNEVHSDYTNMKISGCYTIECKFVGTFSSS